MFQSLYIEIYIIRFFECISILNKNLWENQVNMSRLPVSSCIHTSCIHQNNSHPPYGENRSSQSIHLKNVITNLLQNIYARTIHINALKAPPFFKFHSFIKLKHHDSRISFKEKVIKYKISIKQAHDYTVCRIISIGTGLDTWSYMPSIRYPGFPPRLDLFDNEN